MVPVLVKQPVLQAPLHVPFDSYSLELVFADIKQAKASVPDDATQPVEQAPNEMVAKGVVQLLQMVIELSQKAADVMVAKSMVQFLQMVIEPSQHVTCSVPVLVLKGVLVG